MDYLDESMIKIYKSSEEFFNLKKKDRVILMTTKASKSYIDFKFENGDTLLFGFFLSESDIYYFNFSLIYDFI